MLYGGAGPAGSKFGPPGPEEPGCQDRPFLEGHGGFNCRGPMAVRFLRGRNWISVYTGATAILDRMRAVVEILRVVVI